MKTILVIEFFLLLCLNGVLAQNTDTKPDHRISALNKTLNIENYQGFSSKGEKYERQHPNLHKTPKGNQFKSIPEEGNQKLDSTIVEYWDYSVKQFFAEWKTVYVYDAKGNMTWDIYFNWNDSTNQWVDVSKDEFIYDVNRIMTSKIYYSFKETTKQWADVSKYEYTYDANGNKILQFLYLMDETPSNGIYILKMNILMMSTGTIFCILNTS